MSETPIVVVVLPCWKKNEGCKGVTSKVTNDVGLDEIWGRESTTSPRGCGE
jgi:hypothetical protein